MTDIVEQLRDADAFVRDGINYAHLCWEAADKIEQLRAENVEWKKQAGKYAADMDLIEAQEEIERLKDEIERRRSRSQEFLDELAKWRAGYDVLQKSYLEISKIVGRQGNEEQSLADQVRQLLVERDELLAALDALTSLKTLTTPRSNADKVRKDGK